MPRFLVGDEQGQIKSLEYQEEPFTDGTKYKLTTLSRRTNEGQKTSVQQMVLALDAGGSKAVRLHIPQVFSNVSE
jgi:ribosome biogenesis protein NSA1